MKHFRLIIFISTVLHKHLQHPSLRYRVCQVLNWMNLCVKAGADVSPFVPVSHPKCLKMSLKKLSFFFFPGLFLLSYFFFFLFHMEKFLMDLKRPILVCVCIFSEQATNCVPLICRFQSISLPAFFRMKIYFAMPIISWPKQKFVGICCFWTPNLNVCKSKHESRTDAVTNPLQHHIIEVQCSSGGSDMILYQTR